MVLYRSLKGTVGHCRSLWVAEGHLEDDAVVVEDELDPAHGLDHEHGAGEGEGQQEGALQPPAPRPGPGLLLLGDGAQLLHLGQRVVLLPAEPLQRQPRLGLVARPHQPDRGLGQPPGEAQEQEAGHAEAEVEELDGHHLHSTAANQRAATGHVTPVWTNGNSPDRG